MYLAHHGVKGQKWGVRRYQNPDGTLTEEGKIRYAVLKTSQSVQKSLSLTPPSIKDEPIDISAVKARGSLTDAEAEQCSKLAKDIYFNAKAKEPKITADVLRAVSTSGQKMYGLDHRLKTPSSLAAKIGSDAKSDSLSFSDAAKQINDAIRYTAVSSTADFTQSYRRIKSQLELAGYTEIKCKNYFAKFKEGKVSHKAIQSVFSASDGTQFEFQFQTPTSQAVKELKLPLYNEVRQSSTSEERKQYLITRMNQLGQNIDDPEGVFDIAEHSKKLKHSALIYRTKSSNYIYISRS